MLLTDYFFLADVFQHGRMALEIIMKSILYGDAQVSSLPGYSGNFLLGL